VGHGIVRVAVLAAFLAAGLVARAADTLCPERSLYVSHAGKWGFVAHWRERVVVEVPSHADMEAIFRPLMQQSTPNLTDCSTSTIKCAAIYEEPHQLVLAVKQGRRGDGYSVGHWNFLLIDDFVSISREWPNGEIVEVLVSGRGFLAEPGACK
jgi:hypothetical protein